MKNSGSLFAAVLAVSVSIGLSGCRSRHNEIVHEATPSSKIAEARTRVPIDPATTGAIDGTVHFAGKSPERLKIDMSQDPACSAAGGENFAEQYVVHDGGIANVYVYVKSGPEAAGMTGQVAPAPVVLD